jgi:hypothetical protein
MEMGESHIGNTSLGEDGNGIFFYGPWQNCLLRSKGHWH